MSPNNKQNQQRKYRGRFTGFWTKLLKDFQQTFVKYLTTTSSKKCAMLRWSWQNEIQNSESHGLALLHEKLLFE